MTEARKPRKDCAYLAVYQQDTLVATADKLGVTGNEIVEAALNEWFAKRGIYCPPSMTNGERKLSKRGLEALERQQAALLVPTAEELMGLSQEDVA